MPNGRWFLPVLTINAVGLVDVDAGELITPGVLRTEGDRIVGVGPSASAGVTGTDDQVIDLGDLVLLPGLMDMEVNLLMGGRG